MSNSCTGPCLPLYAATSQEKPLFLNYRIFMVNAGILDRPLQRLSSQLHTAGSLLWAWPLLSQDIDV